MHASGNLYFLFSLRQQLYAIEALRVSMTFSLPAMESLLNAPPYVAGVINLRGTILPLFDLQLLLGGHAQARSLNDAVVVLEHASGSIGIIVNEVSDVILIDSADIDEPPQWEAARQSHPGLVAGMARVGLRIISLLDADLLLQLRAGATAWMPTHDTPITQAEISPAATDFDAVGLRLLQQRAAELIAGENTDSSLPRRQFAAVFLGREYFGLEIAYITEFTRSKNLVPLPNCPPHVLGNMNLRGNILTVIDIRSSLCMPTAQFERNAKIVVCVVDAITVGIAVDEVDDIVAINNEDVVDAPASAHPEALAYFIGTIEYRNKAMSLLNLPALLSSNTLVVDQT
ncbi:MULTISPECIES: chemotaxis protein CheW [unclassified Undibacterium]|uniref:chemotaxis protein CheW n=2 Tax=Pseudomonadati TaxID=3379134 RepID=UPI002AC95E0F|nr:MULTISPECIES: chemotaxis protein CheW [unclassified Undibacterium]MEB0138620.1 chemotaxis protein CheW [Undibacterium sp. CCC2.1]MEB0171421.1 chemotaxis protein CheW [Undibacterium sp. CCC1.1]MEB0175751.1 chemotaxis protein CheW [Undibacterium sp. CCC3.4]MEB0214421.1 chemotaxis protein CheW [Undibacterium sp. 5I2]WPX44286.1 chemotaxis protein CheW [Undibacterium sp. CCC3.4]